MRLDSFKVITLVELLASSIMCKDEKQGLDVVKRLLFCGGQYGTLPVKMFGPFWSVWCKMALAEVGVSLS